MGVDYGRKYLGLALASGWDNNGSPLVVPLPALIFESSGQVLVELLETCKQYSVEDIVFGLPMLPNGMEGGLSKEIRIFSRKLLVNAEKEKGLRLGIHFADERLTSFEAGAVARGIKKTREGKRKLENSLAACLILRNFLDLDPKFTKDQSQNH